MPFDIWFWCVSRGKQPPLNICNTNKQQSRSLQGIFEYLTYKFDLTFLCYLVTLKQN